MQDPVVGVHPIEDVTDMVDKVMDRAREMKLVEGTRQEARPRSYKWLMIALWTLFIGLTAWNLSPLVLGGKTAPQADQTNWLGFTVFVTVQNLEAHKAQHGAYPESLEPLGLDDESVMYTREGRGYTLTVTEDTQSVTYRAGDDISPYAAQADALLKEVK